jgi:tRNA threonylcarbamoyladenosine biosynthesis protein TsaE
MKEETEEVHVSRSAEETFILGKVLAGKLKAGAIVALEGGLGAGKTVFVQGLAAGLGTDPAVPVTSPSYTLVHEYPGPVPLYHLDFYRLSRKESVLGLGLEEYFEGEGVTAVEWAEKFPGLFPRETIWVKIERGPEEERTIRIRSCKQEWADKNVCPP